MFDAGKDDYAFCNNSLQSPDLLGLYVLPIAPMIPSSVMNPKARCEELKRRFIQWYEAEKDKLSHNENDWIKQLPSCPGALLKVGSSFKSPDEDEWQLTSGFVFSLAQQYGIWKMHSPFHPGGEYELRTKDPSKYSGHGNQCIYDKCGKLMTTIPAAGTVDYSSPNFNTTLHGINDVEPFIWAKRLDSECGGFDVYVRKYYEVRPSK